MSCKKNKLGCVGPDSAGEHCVFCRYEYGLRSKKGLDSSSSGSETSHEMTSKPKPTATRVRSEKPVVKAGPLAFSTTPPKVSSSGSSFSSPKPSSSKGKASSPPPRPKSKPVSKRKVLTPKPVVVGVVPQITGVDLVFGGCNIKERVQELLKDFMDVPAASQLLLGAIIQIEKPGPGSGAEIRGKTVVLGTRMLYKRDQHKKLTTDEKEDGGREMVESLFFELKNASMLPTYDKLGKDADTGTIPLMTFGRLMAIAESEAGKAVGDILSVAGAKGYVASEWGAKHLVAYKKHFDPKDKTKYENYFCTQPHDPDKLDKGKAVDYYGLGSGEHYAFGRLGQLNQHKVGNILKAAAKVEYKDKTIDLVRNISYDKISANIHAVPYYYTIIDYYQYLSTQKDVKVTWAKQSKYEDWAFTDEMKGLSGDGGFFTKLKEATATVCLK